MFKNIKNKILVLSSLVPSFVFAMPKNLKEFIDLFLGLLNIFIPILSGIAFIFFFYGMAKFILSSGDSKTLADGKKFILYSILAMFVLLSLGGILQFMSDQLEFGKVSRPFLPQ
jgi:F0F1-type ATP synthase assembly protein I